MRYPTPRAIALAIAVLYKRAGKPRARLTVKTFRLIGRRPDRLHDSTVNRVRMELEELGLILFPLTRGGFGILPAAALDGAPAIRAADHLTNELPAIRRGRIDEEALADELEQEADVDIDSED